MEQECRHIPVIDMGLQGPCQKLTASEEDRLSREICSAFEDIGFAYLKNHGVGEKQIDDAFGCSKTFFSLPQEQKTQTLRAPPQIQGYTGPGMEQLDASHYKLEYRESYDIKIHEGIFPKAVPEFEPSVRELYSQLHELCMKVLRLMGKGLGLEENFIVNFHNKMMRTGNSSILRLLYYPPVAENSITRCGVHTDYGSITLLLQDRVGGLKVRNRSGDFIDAEPIPGTILVNIGDLTEVWTGGKLRATEHMLPIPTDEAKRKSCRYSIALFMHPDDDVLVQPVMGDQLEYQPVNSLKHVLNKLNNSYRKKSA